MAKLHELLAVRDSLRSQAEAKRTDLMNTFEKKRTHFSEVISTFKSKKQGLEDKEESRLGLQTTVKKELEWIGEAIAKAINISYDVDEGNMEARANVTLDNGAVMMVDMPATTLLELEKRMKEIHDLVAAIPTLDPAKGFALDAERGEGIYRARDVEKPRTEKVWHVLELAKATEKHPAQVEKYPADDIIGNVLQQEWCSFITVADKAKMLDRVEDLTRAIKSARSRANDLDRAKNYKDIGEKIWEFVTGV